MSPATGPPILADGQAQQQDRRDAGQHRHAARLPQPDAEGAEGGVLEAREHGRDVERVPVVGHPRAEQGPVARVVRPRAFVVPHHADGGAPRRVGGRITPRARARPGARRRAAPRRTDGRGRRSGAVARLAPCASRVRSEGRFPVVCHGHDVRRQITKLPELGRGLVARAAASRRGAAAPMKNVHESGPSGSQSWRCSTTSDGRCRSSSASMPATP